MIRHCEECVTEGKLHAVAIYSRTLCARHVEAEFQRVLSEATAQDWAAAHARADA